MVFEMLDSEEFYLDDRDPTAELLFENDFLEEEDAPIGLDDEPALVEQDEGEIIIDNGLVPGSSLKFDDSKEDETEEEKEEEIWENTKNPKLFLDYLKVSLDNIPSHSGKTVPGCERALAYLKNLENEISHAMKRDFKSDIDEIELDKIHRQMKQMMDRLERQIDKLRKFGHEKVNFIAEGTCKKCGSEAPLWLDINGEEQVCLACDSKAKPIRKEATTPIPTVYMTPFERAVVGTIINSTVSAGKNIEEVYTHMKNKYNFTPREELSFIQLLKDHGYPILIDRGRINENVNQSSGDSLEFITQYY